MRRHINAPEKLESPFPLSPEQSFVVSPKQSLLVLVVEIQLCRELESFALLGLIQFFFYLFAFIVTDRRLALVYSPCQLAIKRRNV